MIKYTIVYFLFSFSRVVADDCLFFKFCGDSSRSSAKSLPSAATSSNFNPSNVSTVKGVGIETLYQENNPLTFNFVSGNGKMGALVSPTLENSFFGNRSIEIDDAQLIRKNNKYQFKNTKLNVSAGIQLLNKKYVSFEVGVSVKRNPDIKHLNPGVGFSAKLAFLHFGAYFFNDDVKINLGNYISPYTLVPYSSIYNSSNYQEDFKVETYSMGMQIQNLSLDFGIIKTKYNFYSDNTRIYLYSSAYSYRKLLFNFARRSEYSPNQAFVNGKMVIQRKKEDFYYGVQYLVSRYFLVGIQYNNFLLNEWSGTLSILF